MLSHQHPTPPPDQRSMMTRSIEGAITMAAIGVSALGGMALFDLTHEWVHELATRIYGAGGLADFFGGLGWAVVCFGFTFFAARASLLALWLLLAGVTLRYGAGFAF